jgi:hypothetical protein
MYWTGVDKTKNTSGASPFFSEASIFFCANTGYENHESEFENSGAMATGRPVFVYPWYWIQKIKIE